MKTITRAAAGTIPSLEDAFQYCEQLARRHYENFPVASLFLPKHLRPAVAAIYAFARTADDFADEGNRSQDERLNALRDWKTQLDNCFEGEATHPIFVALEHVVRERNIPKLLLAHLLTAFTMDVTKNRYQTFDDLNDYCRHSANPVGRLVLHLFDDASERNCILSDRICTALQLANFWQDISVDLKKNRIYVPLEDIERFTYTETEFSRHVFDERFQSLLKFEVELTRQMFEAGAALLHEATPSLRFELRLTWKGGMTILEKIEKSNFDVFTNRPMISFSDKISMVVKAFFRRK
jgi:squalene synthase HpnC